MNRKKQTLAILPLAALCALMPPLIGLAVSQPEEGAPVLVVVPPWQDAAGIVAGAGGGLIGPLRTPVAVLAAPGGPDFAARLRAAGALGVLDGRAAARICGV